MERRLTHRFNDVISINNLLDAWREFIRGKRYKVDVLEFSGRLADNILELHHDLRNQTYRHDSYQHFRISDPKQRDIHKATVRDRLTHHAIYRILYPFFDGTFIADSYSCRLNKGTHKALNRFRAFSYRESRNYSKTVWVLKCDIRKFFASVDHKVLKDILNFYMVDEDIKWLLAQIIDSFETSTGKGLPLGNLTSQLMVNIYMNEFDQFVKHKLKAKYYIRYSDDFVILSRDELWLESLLPLIQSFLVERLALQLHPNKVSIQTIASGIDFLGWVHWPAHRVLRTATKRRMIKRLVQQPSQAGYESYRGMLRHGNAFKLSTLLHNSHIKDSAR